MFDCYGMPCLTLSYLVGMLVIYYFVCYCVHVCLLFYVHVCMISCVSMNARVAWVWIYYHSHVHKQQWVYVQASL